MADRKGLASAVYRIVQEALTNAAQHAKCQRISVLLQASPRLLSVIVEDDGCGFDVEQTLRAGRERRLGLYERRERVQRVAARSPSNPLLAGDHHLSSGSTGGRMIRVLMADDHTVLRAGLRLLPSAQPDIAVVGEAGDGWQTLKQAEALRPDVILLGLTMPGLPGLQTLALLRQQVPQAKVLILTMHADEAYLRQALAEGAAGYIHPAGDR